MGILQATEGKNVKHTSKSASHFNVLLHTSICQQVLKMVNNQKKLQYMTPYGKFLT